MKSDFQDISVTGVVPISVLIPTRNEEANLSSCLNALKGWADEVVVVDSGSSDATSGIALNYGASIVQFTYDGGWPKKRQWALDTLQFRNEWILLLDADEILLGPIKDEIKTAIQSPEFDGYRLRFQLYFLGTQLRHGGFDLWKLFLFRKGKGKFERRLDIHDVSMSDIEIHEHVIVSGKVGVLNAPIRHENFNSLFRYIEKHNEYSEWESKVNTEGLESEIVPSLFGTQAQKRRWLKSILFKMPGFPIITFLYHYLVRLGFLDGRAGLIYCGLKGVQRFHSKSKVYEKKMFSEQVVNGE